MIPPSHPALTPADVHRAAEAVRGHVRRTPVLDLEPGALGLEGPVALKLECLQVTGTFKARNAFSLLLRAEVPPAGAAAASGGNFGLAMAHAARRLGHRLAVFVPEAAAPATVAAIEAEQAEVRVVPGPPAEAFAAAERHARETGALLAHPYDLPEVVAGAGTCAVELEEQRPELDTVLVAVGGGGLLGGVATWYDGRARVVGVETEGTATLHAARAAGEPVAVEASGIATSALGAPRIGRLGWEAARAWVADSLLVTDDDVADARQRLWAAARLVAEPGGAVALAALTGGAYAPRSDERVGVVVCGGNGDPGGVAGRA